MSNNLRAALDEGRSVAVTPLAHELGVSRVALYLAAKRGEFQTTRIGRRVLVPAAVARRLLGI